MNLTNNSSVLVIIPVYNREDSIKLCLNSLKRQLFTDFVVIVVNDGSSDGTVEIVNNFVANDSRFKLISKVNNGVSSARNAGLDYLDGHNFSYITFIDSDDWVEPDYLLNLVRIIKNNNADAIYAKYHVADGINDAIPKEEKNEFIIDGVEVAKQIVSSKMNSMPYSKLFKSQLWQGIRFPLGICPGEDTATLFKPFLFAKKVVVTNYCGYHLNRFPDVSSTMRSRVTNKFLFSGMASSKLTFDYFNTGCLNEKQVFVRLQGHEVADNYLSIIFRVNKKALCDSERCYLKEYKMWFDSKKIYNYFQPYNKASRLKLFVYKYLRPLYCPLLRMYIYINKSNYRYGLVK